MTERGRIQRSVGWGQAEQAAMERGLELQVGSWPPPTAASTSPELSRVIECEIIPRLLLAHQERQREITRPADPDTRDVEMLIAHVLRGSVEEALAEVASVLARGAGIEAVFLRLLGPTAQALGEMWREDLCTFTDVTVGLSRLQQVLRILGQTIREDRRVESGRVLLAPVPGEQHGFGTAMLEEFFRRAGWAVTGLSAPSRPELLRVVRTGAFELVGLSLSSDVLFGPLRSLVEAIRKASCNRALTIMVGGRYFIDHPGRATEIGADFAAVDAPDALLKAASTTFLASRP